MTAVVRQQLMALAEVIAELKERVRVAVAGELAKAVSGAVHQVVEAMVAGRTNRPVNRHWDDDDDRWAGPAHRWADDPVEDSTRDPRSAGPTVAAAVAAGVGVARWWLARQGTLFVAAGLGLGVGLLGVVGGPLARTAVAALAAATDLLTATDALGDGADRLRPD